jgi:hypothetical protein
VLTKHDQEDILASLERHVTRTPDVDVVLSWLETAGLQDPEVEIEEFTLLFKSSREFFFSPVIEYGPLSSWKDVAGKGQQMQDIFWQIKEAIDAYFKKRAFEVTVKAGAFRGVRGEAVGSDEDLDPITQPLSESQILDLSEEDPDEPETAERPIRDDFHLEEEEDTDS